MSSLMSIAVRPATLRDARAISELHQASFLHAFKDVPTGTPIPKVPMEMRQAYWREAIEYSEPQVHIATSEDGMLGFVGFDRSRDKGTPSTMGEVWALNVLPKHWGRGIGQALWNAARAGLLEEGCTDVSAWVTADDARARNFLELSGFALESGKTRAVSVGITPVQEVRFRRTL